MTSQKKCIVDDQIFSPEDGMEICELNPIIQNLILKDYPKLSEHDLICSVHLVDYRLKYANAIISKGVKRNRKSNERLTEIMKSDAYKVIDISQKLESKQTFGQKLADNVAKFGGSWPFIIIFVFFMIFWIIINTTQLFGKDFDPYPFILLNLFLSMLAAMQAPLIMMSQNRSAEYDRLQADNDYHINQKSENEIREVHSKLDHLLQEDNTSFLEIQKMQLEMLGDIQKHITEQSKIITELSQESHKV
ncbi:membrane protein [Dellaglioa algida]|nr:membrane protein [Dellaglioa algida]